MENEILRSELKGQRTLATVVFTDCVGFSARMSVNEDHTLDLIRRDLKLMKKVCEQFEGRVLKTTGDGLLMCFSSAVKAVECSIQIQQAIAEISTQLPPNDSLMHRIGIHLADMYITETDVMGNGVNIAARLQTEADPGGICISQTVYDVAKHGLQLETEYLGPRELKNIREVVPAFKILMGPENAEDPYLKAARRLEQSQNVSRIRKLLFYVCKHRWENEESHLHRLSLRGQIQEVLGLAASFEQLKGLVNTAVNTLSKRAEYASVADEILKELVRFYSPDSLPYALPSPLLSGSSNLTQAQMGLPSSREWRSQYEQVAWALEHDNDSVRIKKLLYYICRRHWESDLHHLDAVHMVDLVQELHQLAATADQLRSEIDRFVRTLNKRTEYTLVSNALLSKLSSIYPELLTMKPVVHADLGEQTQAVFSDLSEVNGANQTNRGILYQAIAQNLQQDPNSFRIKKLLVCLCKAQWVSDATQMESFPMMMLVEEVHALAPTRDRLQLALDAVVKTLSKSAEYALIAQAIVGQLNCLYLSDPAPISDLEQATDLEPEPDIDSAALSVPLPAAAPISQPPGNTIQSPLSLFDVRLGILKYTNPLKAKILIFSSLHTDFGFSEQDWFQLKMYELDGLLRALLTTCKTYTDLELLLYSTARRLWEPEDLVQTADTVIKCLRTLYIHGNQSMISSGFVEADKMNLDDFEESTQGLLCVEEDSKTQQLTATALLPQDADFPLTSTNNVMDSTQLLPTNE